MITCSDIVAFRYNKPAVTAPGDNSRDDRTTMSLIRISVGRNGDTGDIAIQTDDRTDERGEHESSYISYLCNLDSHKSRGRLQMMKRQPSHFQLIPSCAFNDQLDLAESIISNSPDRRATAGIIN
jgi:hypothetical protein